MTVALSEDLRAVLRLEQGADPTPWLLSSDEPAARFVTLTGVMGVPPDDGDVRRARADLLADAGTRELLSRLPDWETPSDVGGHNSPRYAPNLLALLADMGVGAGDDARVEEALDAFLRHEDEGRFSCLAQWRQVPAPVWSTLPCDTHAIAEALVRFGRGGEAAVGRSLARVRADLAETAQGPGWKCLPDPVVKFRGPGRAADVCLLVTLEALRLLARAANQSQTAAFSGDGSSGGVRSGGGLPEPADAVLAGALRTSLRAWRERGAEKPYMFGHGRGFKTVKWPTSWYDVHLVLDTAGRYPDVWSAAAANAAYEDRRAVAEMAACLVAYNVAADGTVTPQSCYRGFEGFSFGQKKKPSPFATARLLAVLRPFAELADDVAAVDVLGLTSSKGGTGRALPSRLAGRA
jgi:hypothetical protein